MIPSSHITPYQRFRESVFGSESTVCDSDLFANDPAMTPELEWQSRWYAGEFGRTFRGLDGESIEIIQFGWWNRAPGPDFIETAVSINGNLHQGAIELDIDARDWEKHGHATNPNYENVVLHLFFRGPPDRFYCRTPSNRRISQVELSVPTTSSGMREAARRLGRCSTPLAQMPLGHVESFLLQAAHYRANEKAKAILRVATLHGQDQAWFQSLAVALGYFSNRESMRVLAQRLPLSLLLADPTNAEARLFGHAGFLEDRPFDDQTEPDARNYLRELWEAWWRFRGETIRKPHWDYAAQRPANHPQRRVAVLAMLVMKWKEFASLLNAPTINPDSLVKFFSSLRHPFWSRHFTLASDLMPDPVALVGKDRVIDFLGNAVLPTLAQSNPSLWQTYETLPAGISSRSILRANERLLGQRTDSNMLLKRFAIQQGLLQVYKDFCLEDASECAQCPFPEQLARWNPKYFESS